MKDAHIHIEHQPYSLELIDNMVDVALENGIDNINIVDHTHKFTEFMFLYEETKNEPSTYKHYENRNTISINEYLEFIKEVRKHEYPIKLNFGLEVCYFENKETELKNELSKYHFDFLIGSVHHIDGFGFDLGKEAWEGRNVDNLYKRYYEIMEHLIKSSLFTHLAHPDSIKIYGYKPSYDLTTTYEKIAKLLIKYHMTTENNTGFARYGFTNIGLDDKFLKILKKYQVVIYKASDAHKYTDIGNKFNEIS